MKGKEKRGEMWEEEEAQQQQVKQDEVMERRKRKKREMKRRRKLSRSCRRRLLQVQQHKWLQDADEQSHQRVGKSRELSLCRCFQPPLSALRFNTEVTNRLNSI